MKSKWPYVERRLAEIETWLRQGLTEAQVCKNLGISVQTFNEYKRAHPELVEAIKRGKEVIITEIENALVKRALGYDYEETETDIRHDGNKEIRHVRKIRKHMPPDVGACAFLLKNKAPDRYTNDRAVLDFKRDELALRKMLEEAKNW